MASPLQIKVDQSGKPPGVPGQAREDLVLGTAVQLAAVGGPFGNYQWSIAFKPVDVVAGARSSAALSSATTSTTLLQPMDKAGTYRVGIAVDAGFGLGAREQDVAFITFYAGPALNADPTQYPRREPAVGETTEHNAPDAIDPGGNPDGWGRERARWDAAQQAGAATGVVPATASTLAKRGTSGEGYFTWVAPSASGVAQSTLLRMSHLANGAVAARGVGNTWDVMLLGVDGSDGAILGDATNGVSATLFAAGSSFFGFGNFVRVHRSFGVQIIGDATNGVVLGSAGGPIQLLARTWIGYLSTHAQFAIAPRAFSLGGFGPVVVDFDAFGSHPDFTLNINSTLGAPTNVLAGGRYTVTVRQGGGGPYTFGWDPAFNFGSSFSGLVTAGAGTVDIFEFIGDAGGLLYCIGESLNVTAANAHATSPSAVFTISFADWAGLGGATTHDYVLPALPPRARLLCVVVENWNAIDDPTHGTFTMELGFSPTTNNVRQTSNVALGATGYPQSYIGSSPWDGAVGQVGFLGCFVEGEQPMLHIASSVALSTANAGSMYVRLFYYFG